MGPDGVIKFIQMYSDGEGDYTKKRRKKLMNLEEEDLKKYLREEHN